MNLEKIINENIENIEFLNREIDKKTELSIKEINQISDSNKKISMLEELLKIDPNNEQLNAEIFTNIGHVYFDLKKYEEAERNYRKAINLNYDDDDLYNHLGIILDNKDKVEEAIKNLRKAININPNNEILNSNLGYLLSRKGNLEYKKGNLDEAIENLRKAVRIIPNDAVCHHNLGVILKEKGNLDESIKYYKKSIRLNPRIRSYLNLLDAYIDNTSIVKAVKNIDGKKLLKKSARISGVVLLSGFGYGLLTDSVMENYKYLVDGAKLGLILSSITAFVTFPDFKKIGLDIYIKSTFLSVGYGSLGLGFPHFVGPSIPSALISTSAASIGIFYSLSLIKNKYQQLS